MSNMDILMYNKLSLGMLQGKKRFTLFIAYKALVSFFAYIYVFMPVKFIVNKKA